MITVGFSFLFFFVGGAQKTRSQKQPTLAEHGCWEFLQAKRFFPSRYPIEHANLGGGSVMDLLEDLHTETHRFKLRR
ncbi:hypothetical protein PGTUg99_013979 [Puccinia graminis f. sp. tritici]|uniref:Secreted protein n=1 Tax=Puccinia graminis f. sp. tritici TaxID=56615 RepID=A0A5B0NTD7_PUCGR|nr:hypothetical protein PGTUg99_013979 [Puccinia graminis f. sp. tritici]